MKEYKDLSAPKYEQIREFEKMPRKLLLGTSTILKRELQKIGIEIESVPDDKKPNLEEQKRLDAEIFSKHINHNDKN